jgi:hypothetical protein
VPLYPVPVQDTHFHRPLRQIDSHIPALQIYPFLLFYNYVCVYCRRSRFGRAGKGISRPFRPVRV